MLGGMFYKMPRRSRWLIMLFKSFISSMFFCLLVLSTFEGFPGGSDGKASACNARDQGSIPGSGTYPLEKEMAIHSSTLAWKIPWMKEPDRLLAKSRTRLHFHFQGKYGVETGDYLPGKM